VKLLFDAFFPVFYNFVVTKYVTNLFVLKCPPLLSILPSVFEEFQTDVNPRMCV
jgi:hypothetical protein